MRAARARERERAHLQLRYLSSLNPYYLPALKSSDVAVNPFRMLLDKPLDDAVPEEMRCGHYHTRVRIHGEPQSAGTRASFEHVRYAHD